MSKKMTMMLLAMMLLLTCLSGWSMIGSAEEMPISVVIDGKTVDFGTDQAPFLASTGRVLVPMRKIFETMGAKVDWAEETSTVTATKNDTTIVLTIGKDVALKNGVEVKLDQVAEKINDRTFVPIRFVGEALGSKVGWEDKTKQVVIQTITPVTETKAIKILAIGNSFSVDSMQWLYDIAKDSGVEEIVLGNLYIGGCSLATHWTNASQDKALYTYYKNTSGKWQTLSTKETMLNGIIDEEWDIITLQQASPDSGVSSSYEPSLSNLISYVNANKTNPSAKLAWHMTWAYQSNSTHTGFAKYGNDQTTMYNKIVDAVKSNISENKNIAYTIPAGTAIQNVRTSYIGDVLTRDGYHLSLTLGRYIAGLTWFHQITGLPIDNVSYVPSATDVPEEYLKVVKEAVNAAVKNPLQITQSTYTVRPASLGSVEKPAGAGTAISGDVDFSKYTLLDLGILGSSYWNSSSGSNRTTSENSTASNLPYFISTKMFSKAEIPNGSLIVVDAGYQYRPEGWVTLQTKNTTSRPDNVATKVIEVTDSWWGDFQYRAFNISKTGSPQTDISKTVAEAASHFKIYIPKK